MKDKREKLYLRRALAPYRGTLILLCALSSLSVLFGVGFAYAVKYLFPASEAYNVAAAIAVVAGFAAARVIFRTAYSYLSRKTEAIMEKDLKSDAFGDFLRLDYSSLTKKHSQEFVTFLTRDVREIAAVSSTFAPALCALVVQFVALAAALFLIDPLLAAISLSAVVLFALSGALFRKTIKEANKRVNAADAKSRAFMQETLSLSIIVKSYRGEGIFEEKARSENDGYKRERIRFARLSAGFSALYRVLEAAGLIFALVWCVLAMQKGSLGAGETVAAVLLVRQFDGPLSTLSALIPASFSRRACASRITEAIGEQTSSPSRRLIDDPDLIRVKDLSVSYEAKKVIDGVSFDLPRGKFLAVSGETGSGKTTLIKAICGLIEPDKGEITAEKNGVEGFGDYALVAQNNALFSGTILDNVTVFAPDGITEEKVKSALTACAAEFVYSLDGGLNAKVGERGAGLSEGQIQRLCIARALLSGKKVLILDEATSALDEETEKAVLTSLKASSLTCLFVTHSDSVMSIADETIRL